MHSNQLRFGNLGFFYLGSFICMPLAFFTILLDDITTHDIMTTGSCLLLDFTAEAHD